MIIFEHFCAKSGAKCSKDRCHTKRATTKRTADLHRQSLNYHSSKCKLSCMMEQMKALPLSSDNIEPMQKEMEIIKKNIKSLEKKFSSAKINVGNDLFEQIVHEVQKLTSLYEHSIDISTRLFVLQAEFQADSVIAFRSIRRLNDLVVCNDSDQAVHVGDDCCCLNDYKYTEKRNKRLLENISLFCLCRETILEIAEKINITINSPQLKIPQYPIMNNIRYPYLRALIACGIGCDVFLSGVPYITPKKLHEFMLKPKTHVRIHDQTIYEKK